MNLEPVLPDRLPHKTEDLVLLVGRVLLGAIFVNSGIAKLLALGVFAQSLASRGVPAAHLMAYVGAAVEFFGGLLIVSGFKTRPAAVLMILFVIAATLISHRFWEFAEATRRAQESQFFKNVSIIGGFVLLIATGAGRYSVDGFRRRRKLDT